MVSSIRLNDETHAKLSEIKKLFEETASIASGVAVTATFDEVVSKLCEEFMRFRTKEAEP